MKSFANETMHKMDHQLYLSVVLYVKYISAEMSVVDMLNCIICLNCLCVNGGLHTYNSRNCICDAEGE